MKDSDEAGGLDIETVKDLIRDLELNAEIYEDYWEVVGNLRIALSLVRGGFYDTVGDAYRSLTGRNIYISAVPVGREIYK